MKLSARITGLVVLVACLATLSMTGTVRAEDRKSADIATQNNVFLKNIHDFLADPTKIEEQDIDPALFQDFWLKWQLVTTRYKPDGQELRFTYVNDIGASALAKGQRPFPEGTVFAKIGAQAEHDPLFDTSLVPGNIVRIQVMLKKSKDPKAQDGWVYALYTHPPHTVKPFDAHHLSDNEIMACASCHAMAQPRDMVFSLPFPVATGAAVPPIETSLFQGRFKEVPLSALSEKNRTLILSIAPQAKSAMQHEMQLFEGSLFESREILTSFAHSAGKIYILNSPDDNYSLVAVPVGECVKVATSSKLKKAQPFNVWDSCSTTRH